MAASWPPTFYPRWRPVGRQLFFFAVSPYFPMRKLTAKLPASWPPTFTSWPPTLPARVLLPDLRSLPGKPVLRVLSTLEEDFTLSCQCRSFCPYSPFPHYR